MCHNLTVFAANVLKIPKNDFFCFWNLLIPKNQSFPKTFGHKTIKMPNKLASFSLAERPVRRLQEGSCPRASACKGSCTGPDREGRSWRPSPMPRGCGACNTQTPPPNAKGGGHACILIFCFWIPGNHFSFVYEFWTWIYVHESNGFPAVFRHFPLQQKKRQKRQKFFCIVLLPEKHLQCMG